VPQVTEERHVVAASSATATSNASARVFLSLTGLEPRDEVRLDGHTLGRARMNREITVNGNETHAVEVMRSGVEIARREVHVGDGEARTIAFRVPAAHREARVPWGWIGAGAAGAALVAAGTVVLVSYLRSRPDGGTLSGEPVVVP
jgi:hypothetical protein